MFNDHEKTRQYAKVIVEWAPVGYTRKFNYGVLITKTKMFTAEQIKDVADGNAKNQAIIQGNSRFLRRGSLEGLPTDSTVPILSMVSRPR